jgi:CelD/BcsL family acetyltransferase involved in cellulose biosynthesis
VGLVVIEYDSIEKCADIIQDFQKRESINLFFKYEWMLLWKRYFAPGKKEKILVFQEGEEVIGYMPLVYKQSRILPFTVYRYYGSHKSNYMQLPVKKGRAADVYNSAFEFFKRNKGEAILRIDNINDSSDDYWALSKAKGGRKFFQYQCPYAITNDSWDNFFNKHFKKSKRRSKLRSFENKLSRVGNVSFIRINDYNSYMEHKELLEQTFFIHKLRFRNEMNSSRYSEDKYSDFYRGVFREFAISGILDMSLVCIDDIVVSFIMALKQDTTLIHYVPGYHIAFKCFSLGHLHLMKLFQRLTEERQIECFDFSLGSQEYKERWSDDVTSNYSFLFRFGWSPFVWLAALYIDGLTALKLYGRNKGWNSKIKRLLGRMLKKKDKAAMEDGLVVQSSVISNPSTETGYSFTMLMTLPINAQIFVIEQLYIGKKIDFLLKEGKVVGLRTKDAEDEMYYQIIEGE